MYAQYFSTHTFKGTENGRLFFSVFHVIYVAKIDDRVISVEK